MSKEDLMTSNVIQEELLLCESGEDPREKWTCFFLILSADDWLFNINLGVKPTVFKIVEKYIHAHTSYHFKCRIQGHYVCSRGCVIITTIRLQTYFIFSNWNSVSIKSTPRVPLSPSPATTILHSASVNFTTLSTCISGIVQCLFFVTGILHLA